jgi:Flp pilus assembly CpaE family ATPase
MTEEADAGQPVVVSDPDSPAAAALRTLAETIMKQAAGRRTPLPVLRG